MSSTSGKCRLARFRQTLLLIAVREAGRELQFGSQKSWAEPLADLQSWHKQWGLGLAKKKGALGFQVGPKMATPQKKQWVWNRPAFTGTKAQ